MDALDARDRTLEAQNRHLQDFQHQPQEQNDALERRRREAETANGRKTMLFAAVSHDVRTSLAAISLTAQAIGRSASTAALVERIPALERQICVSSITVDQLVSDIVDFSTFELGSVELHPSEFAAANSSCSPSAPPAGLRGNCRPSTTMSSVGQTVALREHHAEIRGEILGRARIHLADQF